MRGRIIPLAVVSLFLLGAAQVMAQTSSGSFPSGSSGVDIEMTIEANWTPGGKICRRSANTIIVTDRGGGICTGLVCDAGAVPSTPPSCVLDADCPDCQGTKRLAMRFEVPLVTTTVAQTYDLFVGCIDGVRMTAWIQLDGGGFQDITAGFHNLGEITVTSSYLEETPAVQPWGIALTILALMGAVLLVLGRRRRADSNAPG